MAVTSTTSKIQYEGNGSAESFPIPFLFLAAGDIKAVFTGVDGVDADLVKDTDYSVTGAGDSSGGTLAFPLSGSAYSTLTAGQHLTIYREMELSQPQVFQNADDLDVKGIEGGDDRATLLIQQLKEQTDRSLAYAITTPDAEIQTATEYLVTLDSKVASATAAQTAAETAQGLAEDARDDASAQIPLVTAAGSAQVDLAETARGLAQAAQAGAEAAQGASEAARDAAQAAEGLVSPHYAAIEAVSADIAAVHAVADDLANIDKVASDKDSIDAVAAGSEGINTCAANMATIVAAPGYAAAAAQSAINAAASAALAANSYDWGLIAESPGETLDFGTVS